MRKLAGLVVCLVIFVIGVYSAGAQMHKGRQDGDMPMMGDGAGQGMGKGMMGEMMGSGHHLWKSMLGLNLDEKQKEAIQAIKSKAEKDAIKKNADKQIAAMELNELLAKESVDMKAVEAKVKQIEALRTDMQLSQIRAIAEAKSKLTPEQRKKLSELAVAGHMMQGKQDKNCGMMDHDSHAGHTSTDGAKPQSDDKKQPASGHSHH